MQVLYDGVYNIQFSAQIFDSDDPSGSGKVNIFPRINGINVQDSNTYVTMDNQDSYVVAAWNFVLKLNANDIIELIFYTTDTGIKLLHEDAIIGPPAQPAVPSLIVTVTQVAYSGPTGSQGPTGFTGPRGDTGSNGIVQGITGATGINVDSTDPSKPIININSSYLSGNYLPLSGGTMSGSITMGSLGIGMTGASFISTTTFTLNSNPVIYGATGASSISSNNLYVNNVAVAPFLYALPNATVITPVFPSYNGENWIFGNSFVGSGGGVTNFYVNTTGTVNQYSIPKGFYLNLNSRKDSPNNITINVYNMSDPLNPGILIPVTGSPFTLSAASSRYLYWSGSLWSLI
jgi:hypothetical protein